MSIPVDYLEFAADEAAPMPPLIAMPTEAGVPVVAVVDDDERLRKSLARLIRAAGWDAETFSSEQEFMARMPAPDAACVLLDVQMQGCTGPQLHEWMARVGMDWPVVFLTAHGDVRTGVEAMKRGAVDFLLKPVDDEVLLEAISHAIIMHGNLKSRGMVRERYACLTAREREVMRHVIGGRLNKQIAADLGIVEKTVKVHRARVMEKMEVRSLAALVHACNAAGILPA